MKRTLLRCGWIVSVDDAVGDFTGGDILIDGDRIAAVGRDLAADADEVVDARGLLAMPGLVNAHMHSWQTGFRNIGGDWMSADYFRHVHGTMGSLCGPQDNYLATLVGALDQINGGVTTLGDWCHNLRNLEMAERAIDGLQESGIRAVFFHGTAKPEALADSERDAGAYTQQPHPRARVEALRKGRLASDDALVTMALGILGPDLSTAEVCLHDFRLAREFGLLSSAHWYRPAAERIEPDILKRLAAEKLLGPDHNISHGNFLSDEELDIAVGCGASFTSTCLIELRGASPEPLMRRLMQRGVMPSLGIDVPATAATDMFAEMRIARYTARREQCLDHKRAGHGLYATPPQRPIEALTWATVGGARVLGLERQVGSLTPGKKADIILIDAGAPALAPMHHPVNAVVDAVTGAQVDSVIIDGEFRKRGGRLVYPAERLRQRTQALCAASARIIAASGVAIPGIALQA